MNTARLLRWLAQQRRRDVLTLLGAVAFACFLLFAGVYEQIHGTYPWEDPETAVRGSRQRQQPILFVHLHKAAGSTMCFLARSNGETMLATSLLHNCNILNDGTKVNRGEIPPLFDTCQERVDFLRDKGVTFCGLEHYLEAGPLCTDALHYVTVLRDPMARIRSLASFSHWNGSTLVRWATASHAFDDPWYHHVDNYYIRTLCGPDVFHMPRGSIGLAELQRAEAVLRQFQSVLILEDWDEQYPQLLRSLQWTNPLHGGERVNPSTSDEKSRYFLDEEQAAVLEQVNRWDITLYRQTRAWLLLKNTNKDKLPGYR